MLRMEWKEGRNRAVPPNSAFFEHVELHKGAVESRGGVVLDIVLHIVLDIVLHIVLDIVPTPLTEGIDRAPGTGSGDPSP